MCNMYQMLETLNHSIFQEIRTNFFPVQGPPAGTPERQKDELDSNAVIKKTNGCLKCLRLLSNGKFSFQNRH